MKNLMGFSLIDSTAQEVDKTLKDFYNVRRLCLEAYTKAPSQQQTSSKQKWVFPIGDEKQKHKTKTKTHWQGESEIRTWILEGWVGSAGSAANQPRSRAGSSNVDRRPSSSADDRQAQPSRGCSEASMESLECRGLVIRWGSRRDECSDEEQGICSAFFWFLSGLKN